MQPTLFTEKQFMRQWWLMVVLAIPIVLFLWAFIQQTIMGHPFGNQPMSDFSLLIMGLLMVGLSTMMWTSNLKTTYTTSKLIYRFYPFHLKTKEQAWSEVKKATLVRYRPIPDYGGWGLRYSMRNGRAFNVSGNIGVRLELKDGKQVLFGTQKPDEIVKVFEQLKVPFKNEL